MDSALTQVLRLPELLELILLHLSQKDILLCQRTSRSFRHTILGSIRLQRALFLAPDWKLINKPTTPKNRPEKPENNRLLLRAFPGNYPTVTLAPANEQPTPTDLDLALGRRTSEHWSWTVCISFPADKPPNTSANPAVLYPEASWRRMFLSQPPCRSLHLVRRWHRSVFAAMVRDEGIRMGEFCAETVGAKDEGCWHKSYVSSDRDWHFEGSI